MTEILLKIPCRILIIATFLVGSKGEQRQYELQASVPVTVAFDVVLDSSVSLPPLLLSVSSAKVALSLSFCPLSPHPQLLYSSQDVPSSIMLSTEKMSEILKLNDCPNQNTTTIASLFFTLISADSVSGSLSLETLPTSAPQNSPSSVDAIGIPGRTTFQVNGNQYQSFVFQPRSISNGMTLTVALAHGTAEVFISHCSDFEGVSQGSLSFPLSLSLSFDPSQWVSLIDSSSCPDTGALYHDLDRNPPGVIVRIRSSDAAGVIIMSDDVVTTPTSLSLVRSQPKLADGQISISENETFDYDLSLMGETGDFSFRVLEGSVSLSVTECDEMEEYFVGIYYQGEHSIPIQAMVSNNESQCANSSDHLTLIFSSLDGVVVLSLSVPPLPEQSLPIWQIVVIVLVSTVAVLGIGIAIYMFSQLKRQSLNISDERHHNTYNIPMTTSWM